MTKSTTVLATDKPKNKRKTFSPESLTDWLTHSFTNMLTPRGASIEDLLSLQNLLVISLVFLKFARKGKNKRNSETKNPLNIHTG